MNRLLAILQIGAAMLLALSAIATLVNMLLIAMRPETISVVNVFVGQGVLIVCLAALARLVFARGRARWASDVRRKAATAATEDSRA